QAGGGAGGGKGGGGGGDAQAGWAWPLYGVSRRARRGLTRVRVGPPRGPAPQRARRPPRDLSPRRNEGVSIWVVAAADITASSPDEKDPFFAPSGDKVYRHPTFYSLPDDVPHM